MKRSFLFLVILVSTLCFIACSGAAAQGSDVPIAAGAYRGSVRCTGSDRFSNGSPTRRYKSFPAAVVTFAANQRVTSWTYLFLLRHDLIKQVRAVHRGQSFTYAAGKHIGRPGRTRVTIIEVARTRGQVLIVARLDWASPATHYVGSGTYVLLLTRVSATDIRYEALKVVVKHPLGARSRGNPVVRRNELCIGDLAT
jgi:hypothetical protein